MLHAAGATAAVEIPRPEGTGDGLSHLLDERLAQKRRATSEAIGRRSDEVAFETRGDKRSPRPSITTGNVCIQTYRDELRTSLNLEFWADLLEPGPQSTRRAPPRMLTR